MAKGNSKEAGRGSQVYLAVPNGVILCVDEADQDKGIRSARLYHGYAAHPAEISGIEQILPVMENLFDSIGYPQRTQTPRSFIEAGSENPRIRGGRAAAGAGAGNEEVPGKDAGLKGPRNINSLPRLMPDEELLDQRGSAATFIIRVQQRQNSDWQGRLTWIEKDKTLGFHTIMEMLKLIEEAL